MKFQKIQAMVAVTLIGLLTSCGGASGSGAPELTLTQSSKVIAAGSKATFSAQPGGNLASATPTWVISGAFAMPSVTAIAAGNTDVGTLSVTSGDTVTYTAPATPPVYVSAGNNSYEQGFVGLTVSASAPAGNGVAGTLIQIPIAITAPSMTAGISPLMATVALSGTQQFNGYAVGDTNNGVTWQVNGVTGGSTATGTVTTSSTAGGLYTAPAAMPMTGSTVTVTVISQADTTKSASAVVTLH
jgi:hypothetical protein